MTKFKPKYSWKVREEFPKDNRDCWTYITWTRAIGMTLERIKTPFGDVMYVQSSIGGRIKDPSFMMFQSRMDTDDAL